MKYDASEFGKTLRDSTFGLPEAQEELVDPDEFLAGLVEMDQEPEL